MRIGMILDAPFPPDVRVENEAISLLKEGHEVVLFSLDFQGRRGEEIYKGIRIVRYPAGTLLYKLSALAYTFPFYHWRVQSLVKNFIQRLKPEVLHVHDMVIAQGVIDANRSFKLPVVLDLHENRPEIMKEYLHVNKWPGKWMIDLKQWSDKYYGLSRIADYVVVVTNAAKDDIITKTGKSSDSVVAVPNTVRVEEFLDNDVDPEVVSRMKGFFNLLYIGDTSLRRGTDTAIQAVATLKEKIPNIKLWLIGKSSADHALRQLTHTLGVVNHVVFEGWQDPSRFASYANATDLTLSPLKRNPHHDTTYANKIFQYMAWAKPLVVSNCTAQADLVLEEKCGLVHEASNHEALAEKILFVHDNKEKAKEMGEQGYNAVISKWNWQETVKPLISLYQRF